MVIIFYFKNLFNDIVELHFGVSLSEQIGIVLKTDIGDKFNEEKKCLLEDGDKIWNWKKG